MAELRQISLWNQCLHASAEILLIKLLLLTTSLMGQLQAIVKSDSSLSHTVSKWTSIFDSMIQGTDGHCSVCTGPTQNSSE